MKKLLLTTAVLLTLSLNTVSANASDVISGEVIASHDLTHYKILKDNKTYDLKLTQATDLKNQQTVEVKGDFVDDRTIKADEVIVLKKLPSNSS